MTDKFSTTIVAPATAMGGAMVVVRMSGPDALPIAGSLFSRPLSDRTATFGQILSDGRVVDEVVATYFKAPRSYTGEDTVEFSCHGSRWVVAELLRLLCAGGAVMALAGEFSQRAFLNGKMDLSQTEAVADLIASQTASAARMALTQMRGGYSAELRVLNAELLNILSLLELELDFSEEEVEFADRATLRALIEKISERVDELAASFSIGNVIKNGVPVAIVGRPNVGKSTLLNRLLGEERAIVSSVAGTTRDFIEEVVFIDDIPFRFIDTAGLRTSDEEIEKIGIERSYDKLRTSTLVIHMVDDLSATEHIEITSEQKLITVLNKSDIHDPSPDPLISGSGQDSSIIPISAKFGHGLEILKQKLVELTDVSSAVDTTLVVSNARHYDALKRSSKFFCDALSALNNNLPSDLIASEIRSAMHPLGEITGKITTHDILGNIFSHFCIGK